MGVDQGAMTRRPTPEEIEAAKAVLELENSAPRRERKLRPWATAVALMRADGLQRLDLSRSRRCHDRKIAALDPHKGRRLDDLGATYRAVRWVAAPGSEVRSGEVDFRYRALVAFLEGRSEHASLASLYGSHKRFDPHTGEELPARSPAKAEP